MIIISIIHPKINRVKEKLFVAVLLYVQVVNSFLITKYPTLPVSMSLSVISLGCVFLTTQEAREQEVN
jgi:hypothetical protein